jgi:hypothetical protein
MPLVMRVMPSLRNATLKLINKPNRLSANRRCVNSCFLGTGATASTDLISTITLSSTSRSARNPVSIRAPDRLWEQPAAGPCTSLAFPVRMPGPLRRPIPADRVRGWYECGRPRPRSASPLRFRPRPVKNNLSPSRQDRKENLACGCEINVRKARSGRSAFPREHRCSPFCRIVSVESRNPKCERRTPCNILRTNIGTRLMER